VTRDGLIRNVTDIEIDNGPSAGVRLRVIGKGMVPVFEEQDVRLESRFSLEEWENLPYMERVIMVALRRIKSAIEAIQAETYRQDMDRKTPKGHR
jgi:hypothetical protein